MIYNFINVMKKMLFLIIILILLISGCAAKQSTIPKVENKLKVPYITEKPANNLINHMKLTSSAFKPNEKIPAKYTCDGANINPPLTFSDVPVAAKSLALIVDDPDAPSGTWLHWTVWNISPETKEIAENSVPVGAAQGRTDFGRPGYGGPCPPSGVHHYYFKLYALATTLNLSSGASLSELQQAMNANILEQTELVGLYSRK